MDAASSPHDQRAAAQRFEHFSTWSNLVVTGVLPILLWITQTNLGRIFADYELELSSLTLAFLSPLATLLSAVPLVLVIIKELLFSDSQFRLRCDTLIGILAAVIYAVGAYALLSPVFTVIDKLAPG